MKTGGNDDDDDDDIAMKDGTPDILGGEADGENEDDEDEDVYVRIRCLPERVLVTSALLTLSRVQSLIHRRFVVPALDASNRTARTIVSFLLQR